MPFIPSPPFLRALAIGALCLLWGTLGSPLPARGEDPWLPIRADVVEARWPSALARLQALILAEPNNREATYYLALVRWRMGDDAGAAAAYRRLSALDPEGALGQEARVWLQAFELKSSPSPSPRASSTSFPQPSGEKATPTPWLLAKPLSSGRRVRSRNARPGYFKAADGTFEFVPPSRWRLLDEGLKGNESRALFGSPPESAASRRGQELAPPTLLIVWREYPDLKLLPSDRRLARESQALLIEARTYGPAPLLETRFGGPCYRVMQQQGDWEAMTLLFFQNGRLYAMTYGGQARRWPRYRAQVERSWMTSTFYP